MAEGPEQAGNCAEEAQVEGYQHRAVQHDGKMRGIAEMERSLSGCIRNPEEACHQYGECRWIRGDLVCAVLAEQRSYVVVADQIVVAGYGNPLAEQVSVKIK